MQVKIKDFSISLDVKNTGLELEIHDTNGQHLGDLIINRRSVEWCNGRTTRGNGKRITWTRLIELFNEQDN